jgi:tetrahydromethanopterin S-methyltransferase subunit B
MSKKEVLKAEEAVEVMQTTGVPAQETEEVSTVLATEIIADLKKERDDLQENLDICAGLADRYMYRQGIIECALKLKNERLLRCAYAYMKKLSEGKE